MDHAQGKYAQFALYKTQCNDSKYKCEILQLSEETLLGWIDGSCQTFQGITNPPWGATGVTIPDQ